MPSVESTVAFVIVSVTVVGTVTTVVLVSAPDVCETELEVVPSVESTVAFVIVSVTVVGTVTTIVLVSTPDVCVTELEVVKLVPSVESTVAFVIVSVTVVGTVTTVVLVSTSEACVIELVVVKLTPSVESTVALVIAEVVVVEAAGVEFSPDCVVFWLWEEVEVDVSRLSVDAAVKVVALVGVVISCIVEEETVDVVDVPSIITKHTKPIIQPK